MISAVAEPVKNNIADNHQKGSDRNQPGSNILPITQIRHIGTEIELRPAKCGIDGGQTNHRQPEAPVGKNVPAGPTALILDRTGRPCQARRLKAQDQEVQRHQ